MRLKTQNTKFKVVLILSTLYILLFTSLGCEAFRRKFVRRPKKERKIEVVVHTQEYEQSYFVGETYKKYFLFWHVSHEELINLLNAQDGNRKKLLSSAKKIIENLQQMQQLLLPEKQNKVDAYILKQKSIARQLDKYNISRAQKLRIKSVLEKQRRQIQKEFAFKQIEENLIK